ISGDITITGNSTYYDGVSIQNGAAINSTGTDTTAAKITISGTTGTGFDGIYIEGANTTISSISGDISLSGNSDGYNGIYIGYGAKVKSTGTDSNAAKISIMGTTTSTYSYEGEYSNGVWLYGTDTEVSSISGNITITGSSTKDNSVVIEYDAVVKSTGTGVNAATITIQGTSTADGDDGVEISDGAHISSVDGNISITGSSEDDDGVNIQYGAIIESTGTGALAATITITGTGVNDMDAMNGFEPDDGIDFDSLAHIRSTDGNILLTGTTSADRGVTISASQISTDGTASVTIEGTGGTLGNSDGVNLGSVGQINLAGSGNLDVTGTSTIGAEIRMALGALGFITTTGGTQTYNSNVVLDDDSELSGADIDFLDGISGASMLTLSPTGTATLAAGTTSDFTGNITVTSGTLLALGDTSDQTATVNIQDGATLAGTGSVLANVTVESGGILGPGQSPGILTTGNLSLQTGATFDVEINGRAAGTEYDQVSVAGTVNLDSDTLGGATLNLLLGYTPVGGEQYTIIKNDDVDAISGTFNGLAEGATFVSGGVTFGISYVGGDGNDVVLSVKPPTTIVVTTATDEADGTIDAAVGTGTSLREAILAANLFPDTNIITFDSSLSGGTILIGDSGLNLDLLISTDLTIDGSSLMTPVIVDAERDNRVFTINSGGTGIEVTLDSLTIQNGGLVTNGGNIRVVNAADTLNLLNSTVSGGRASANGGGLDNNGGTVVIDNVTFTNDRAIQFGGAIFNSGDLTVQNTTISGNQSISSGGAIYNKGTLQVSYSLIDDNLVTADLYAGGIYNKSGATAVVTGSTISNNEAGDEGGGIWNQGTFTLLNSTVSGNISDIDDSDAGGAGIYNNGGTLSVINSTISGNNAGGAGGGIFAKGTVNIVNSTIFSNTANNGGNEGGGGGIFANNNNLTLSNSIVINNDDVLDGSGDDIAGGTVNSNGFNIIGDVTGATINVVGMGTDITGVLATDVLETTLANNGGPTLTHALFRNSLAINAGNDTDALDTDFNPLVTDQRGTGFSRFVGTVDIGAVEADFMDLSVTIADSTDPVVTGSSTTYTVTIANAGPNTATGAAFDNTITYAGGSYTLSNISLLFSSTGGATLILVDGNGPDLTNLILASGETATLTYTLTVDAGTGVISNVGTLTAGAETDIDNSNDSATEETLVIPPATILVTTATDEADGTIDPSQGTGTSLREAIIAANLNPDVNTI
ncbi:MAG: hypothetical protein KDA78_15795, partial [Planctomycetaceae bacterium]|nr:hypothetical protein [Planctomycetaceae bacterium]